MGWLVGYYFPVLVKSSLQWEFIFVNQDVMGWDEIPIFWIGDDYTPRSVDHGHDPLFSTLDFWEDIGVYIKTYIDAVCIYSTVSV